MYCLNFGTTEHQLHSALFLGAHCDDIEIGCGATILRLAEMHPELQFHWIVFSSNSIRAKEATISQEAFLAAAPTKTLEIKSFRNGFFPYIGSDIKDYFEEIKKRIQPDVIFTHYRNDLHQDHRIICELIWNTFRDHWILEYEIPKYDGGLGCPNVFVPGKMNHVNRKFELLLECFKSQKERPWFSRSTFEALMRLRGLECNADSGYAEAFYARKLMLR